MSTAQATGSSGMLSVAKIPSVPITLPQRYLYTHENVKTRQSKHLDME